MMRRELEKLVESLYTRLGVLLGRVEIGLNPNAHPVTVRNNKLAFWDHIDTLRAYEEELGFFEDKRTDAELERLDQAWHESMRLSAQVRELSKQGTEEEIREEASREETILGIMRKLPLQEAVRTSEIITKAGGMSEYYVFRTLCRLMDKGLVMNDYLGYWRLLRPGELSASMTDSSSSMSTDK